MCIVYIFAVTWLSTIHWNIHSKTVRGEGSVSVVVSSVFCPLVNGSYFYYFPFEESDHIPPSPKSQFCVCLLSPGTIWSQSFVIWLSVFPHKMTDSEPLPSRLQSVLSTYIAVGMATNHRSDKGERKEESESPSPPPPPANLFSFLESFPFLTFLLLQLHHATTLNKYV